MIKLNTKIIFFVISVIYLICNIIWWKLNTPIIPLDISALHFYDIFKTGYLYYNAPLITWIMKGMFFVFGQQYFDLQIIFVNYIFFLIALYFIYKIGLNLKDKETGNIAMILFALTPAIYGMSRQYGHQDWHVMVAMAVNIYCLIKSDNFKDRKWSIIYGISVGFGLLIKDEFLAYFFAPWLYVVIRSLIERSDLKRVINILTTIITGSLIAGCHYFRQAIIYKIWHEPIVEKTSVFSFDSLKVLTLGLSNEILSPIIFIFVLFAMLWFLKFYKSKNKNILLLWIFVPWFIIMFMAHHKLVEYGVAFVPALILILSMFISKLKYKKILFIIMVSVCVLQYINFSYAINKKETEKINNLYFNRYNLVYYDKDKAEPIIDLFKYINENLKQYNILFEDLTYFTPIDRWSVVSYLSLQNILFTVEDTLNETKLQDYDVVIFIGDRRTTEEKVLSAIKLFEYSDKIYDYVYNNIYTYFVNREKFINENFSVLNELCLEKANKEQVKVTVLKKKNFV